MTGRYNYRTRCIDTYIGRAMMDSEEVTIAEILRDAGYATGIFGKWHLGDNYPMRPIDQGFQSALVHRGGGIGQPSDPPGGEGKYTDPILFRNGKAEQMKGYCTDIYYENAIQFIEQSRQEKRPFFIYLPDNCPHGPFHDVPEKEYAMYREMDLSNQRFPQDKGHSLPGRADTDKRARIFAMITNVDNNVGRLFGRLDALGLTENTIVIFMVDNGPNGRRYVAGMKGMKSHVHEGGIRSPFIVHWPAALRAGHKSPVPAAHIDVLPTLLDAAGVGVPQSLKLDGRSMLADLKGQPATRPERTIYIQAHRGDRPVPFHNFAARGNRWKLLHASGFGRERFDGEPKFELYDLQTDPLEMHDLASQRPDILRRMKSEYEAWFDDVSSTRPDNYAPPRICVGTPHENPTVLTRQDWRHTQGRPWERDSQGHWLLCAERDGKYKIACRFHPSAQAGTIQLRVNQDAISLPLAAGDQSATFQGVVLQKGNVRLEAVISDGNVTRGAHQVDVWQGTVKE
jgi:arylsulfatase/arylsulfatase A